MDERKNEKEIRREKDRQKKQKNNEMATNGGIKDRKKKKRGNSYKNG